MEIKNKITIAYSTKQQNLYNNFLLDDDDQFILDNIKKIHRSRSHDNSIK